MRFLRHWLGITKLDKVKNQSIREKTGAQKIVKEIKQYQQSGYNTYRGWTQIDYQNRHCIIDRKENGTWDDQGGDGRIKFTLRIKEQTTRLTLHEHDDDDDDDDMLTLRHIRITAVAVEKHAVFCMVCVCIRRYPACQVHGLVICVLSGSTIFLYHKWNN
jgi:hypothetical protein